MDARATKTHGVEAATVDGNGRVSNSNKAYEKIKRQILDNKIVPGELVSMQQLVDQFDMSRTPIREALVRLENEKLIELIPKHGMRVLPVSADDMREIYWLLPALESLAIELIGHRRLTKRDFMTLKSLADRMVRALDSDDLDEWSKADEEFHREIVTLAGNSRLINIVSSFRDQTHRARLLTLRLRPKPVVSTQEHSAFVEAVTSGEIEKAKDIHDGQWNRSRDQLLDILERFGIMRF
jgi:DNA-binding GntR family transcriptional regulator